MKTEHLTKGQLEGYLLTQWHYLYGMSSVHTFEDLLSESDDYFESLYFEELDRWKELDPKPQRSKSLHELDSFLNGNNEQPTTCPKCGSRTEFIEIAIDKQQHKCLRCQYEFFMDFEEEEYELPDILQYIKTKNGR